MDRRASLAILLGKQKKSAPKPTSSAPVTNTFAPYSGAWGYEQAAHLLRRTTFGPTYSQIKQATADGLDATISLLFENQPLPDLPIIYDFQNDPLVPLGESWVTQPETPDINGIRGARRRSVRSWIYKTMFHAGVNIREKMTLFWHNHFVVGSTNNPTHIYTYYNLLRENALGNFKTFVEKITIDPSMLIYLNGTQNSDNAPNENFSRELLELFTIGKGPAAGPGDYTNYTEDDVVELARALTGWRHFTNGDTLTYEQRILPDFISARHDENDKQLSARFNNVVITNQGEEEYKTVIDIIFQQDEVARFISRKLYRWFVGSEISSDIETNIIEPMAQLMISSNYDVQPAIMALLSSEHFYDVSIRGCMVTHPVDFLFKMIKTTGMDLPDTLFNEYRLFNDVFNSMEGLQMIINDHPNVAGWKAFYQAPQFYKIWINSVSLPIRMRFADALIDGAAIPNTMGYVAKLNVLDFAAALDNPVDPNDLINEIASIFFVEPISQNQLDALKDVLIPGLPDFEWEVEYTDYISGNAGLEEAIENKLKALIRTMLKMPEFYMI